MLKIGNVNWRGRCGKHPTYNPAEDGEGGIRGGCTRCYALSIQQQHAALMRCLKEFGPIGDRKRKPIEMTNAHPQISLFD